MSIFKFLNKLGSLNVLILIEKAVPEIFIHNIFKKRGGNLNVNELTSDSSIIFHDKLENMYKVVSMSQYTRLEIRNDKTLHGIDAIIMNEVAKHQNAIVRNAFLVNNRNDKKSEIFNDLLVDGSADFSLNTIFTSFTAPYRFFIKTYDQNGYCAVVPISKPLSFLHLTRSRGRSCLCRWSRVQLCGICSTFVRKTPTQVCILCYAKDSDSTPLRNFSTATLSSMSTGFFSNS